MRPVRIEGDLTRLAQVVSNLLNNAARYTPHGGRIEVAARTEGEHVRIDVRDNGIGISAGVLPHVFDLFAQGEGIDGQAQGGLGIGLWLVRQLVELHHGRVEAASEGPGRGSRFTVTLPAQA
jgi:signal transduction histidine kinase